MSGNIAETIRGQRGITSVEYGIILILIVLAVMGTIYWLADPTDPFNSLMPKTYNAVGNKVGNYGLVNVNGNQ